MTQTRCVLLLLLLTVLQTSSACCRPQLTLSLPAVIPPRFQQHVLAHLPDGENWCIPKMYNMRKYEELIAMFGNVEQLSSAPGERSNADLKAHAAFTNRRPTYIDQARGCLRWRFVWQPCVCRSPDCSRCCCLLPLAGD